MQYDEELRELQSALKAAQENLAFWRRHAGVQLDGFSAVEHCKEIGVYIGKVEGAIMALKSSNA